MSQPPVTRVYVDALNFYYGAVQGTPHKWVDLEALARLLVPNDTIDRIKYFTAVVKPLHADDRAPDRQRAYLAAIEANPLVEVVRGHFRVGTKWRALAETEFDAAKLFQPDLRPTEILSEMLADAANRRTGSATKARVVIPEEKGSDVNLGAHIVYDALKGACTKAVVITNDSDLAEPIRLAVNEGVLVGLVNPHRTSSTAARLRDVASFELRLRANIVGRCQLPDPVMTPRGKTIRKPVEWFA